MRMNKVLVGLLVLGLAVSVVGMIGFAKKPSSSANSTVVWTIQEFIELTVNVTSFDFETIDAGVDEVTEDDAVTLSISSNTEWVLSFSKSGGGSDHLSVSLSSDEGENDATVTVDYTLNDLRSMDAGDYTVTVTYTVTAK